jgi:hypothetical protein
MSARTQLETYLGEFRRRLRSLILARGAAMLAVAALALTLGAVFIGTRRAFADSVMISARLLLVAAIVGLIVALVLLPLRRLKRTEGVAEIERRAPDFDGRIETYRELSHRTVGGPSVFIGLLAEDALRLARRIPVKLKVRNWEISTPAAAAIVAFVTLVWFAAYGPDNWRRLGVLRYAASATRRRAAGRRRRAARRGSSRRSDGGRVRPDRGKRLRVVRGCPVGERGHGRGRRQ